MKQTEQGAIPSLLAATAAGMGTVWVIGLIFREAGTLQSSGNIDLRNAIGHGGEIYLTIPPADIGKVKITVQERLRIYDAVSIDKAEIKTGQRIRVVDVTPQDVLVVEKAE
jgi:membrane-bound ClpP family serine protease